MAGLSERAAGAFALAVLLLQSACMPLEPGHSGVDAELTRLQGEHGFAVVSSSPTRTVFAAKGRQVVVAPTDGFCVAADSLDVSQKAAFALLSDCGRRAEGRRFPAVLTVSISGAPMIDPGRDSEAALTELESFLTGQGGLALLGRDQGSREVSVVATRRVGDGLYVLVEDLGPGPLPVLGARFWRCFVELGGRMAMVTLSSFRDAPLPEDQMLAFLVRQVVALRRANNAAPKPDELEMATAVDEVYTIAGTGREAETLPEPGYGKGTAADPVYAGPATGEPVYAGPSAVPVATPTRAAAGGEEPSKQPTADPTPDAPVTTTDPPYSPGAAGDPAHRGPAAGSG